MNFNSGLTKILVEVGAGIVSGMLIEILLEILLYLLVFPFALFYITTNLFSAFLMLHNWKVFLLLYFPFLLIKLSAWLILCWIFGKVGNTYFGFAQIHSIIAGLIGFYTLVYWTLYEISRYATELAWSYPQIKSFWEKLPKPPSYLILEPIYNKLISWLGIIN